MLNRRILRVKAFQSLYAYTQCKASNFNLAKDFINASFLPDLDSMEVQDKPKLKKEAEVCIELFSQNLNNNTQIAASPHSTKIKSITIKAINDYHKRCDKDLELLRNNMLTAVERIPQLYLSAIQILIAFGDHVQNEFGRKRKFTGESLPGPLWELNLAENKILHYLKSAPRFEAGIIRHHAHIPDLEL